MVVLIILLKVIPMDVLMVGVLMIIPIVITMVSAGGYSDDYSDGCSDRYPKGFCWVLF